MREGLRQIQEKRRIAIFTYELQGLFGVALGQGFEPGRILDHLGVVHQHTRIHVVAVGDAEVLIKAAPRGQILGRPAQVPFADAHGLVILSLQQIRERRFIQVQPILVLWEKDSRHADACGISAGEQGRARGRANRIGRTEIGEAGAVGGHAIQVGSPDFRAVAAQVAVTEVVTKNHDDVGLLCGRRQKLRGERRARGSEKGPSVDHAVVAVAAVRRLKRSYFFSAPSASILRAPPRISSIA